MPEHDDLEVQKIKSDFPLEEMIRMDPLPTISIGNWMESEFKYWHEIEQATNFSSHAEFRFLAKYFDVVLQLSRLNSEGQQIFGFELATEVLRLSQQHSIPKHDELSSQEFKRAAKSAELLDVSLYAYKTGKLLKEKSYTDIYTNKYLTLIENHERSHSDILKSINETSEKVKNELFKSTQTCQEQLKKTLEDSSNRFIELADYHEEKLNDTSGSIAESIRSHAPYTYWTEKQKTHKSRSFIFGISAAVLAVFLFSAISILLYAVYTRPSEMQILGKPVPDHFFLAIAVLSASTGIWALKILIKLMMTNISMEAEANERSTAIRTYVALIKSNIDKEVSNSFHKSLLSFGSVKIEDDTSPDLVKVLELIVKKK